MSAAVLGSYAQISTSRRAPCAVTRNAGPPAPAPPLTTPCTAIPASSLSIWQISCPSAKRENSSLNAGTERRRRIWIERPAGTSGRRKIVGKTARKTLRACPCDHDCIVGAKRRRRHDEAEAVFLRDRFERGCKSLVGRDTACDDECALRLRAEALDIEFHGARRPVPDDVSDGLLEARGEIGDVLVAERRAGESLMSERGLEACKGEMRLRSEERRVGKECRSRGGTEEYTK